MRMFKRKFDDGLIEAFYKYTVRRDDQNLVYIVYCNRCLALVDISPFSSDISDSCAHHDQMHEKAQIGYCYSSCAVLEAEEAHIEETGDMKEQLRHDAMWYRRMFWQTQAKAKPQLDGGRWHSRLCEQFGHAI